MLNSRVNIRGDTLIEVLFAIMVFSLVAVSSMSIMNQGTATAQTALEITLVRQGIDAQAETLRFLHASYIASDKTSVPAVPPIPADQWSGISAQASLFTSVSAFGTCSPPSNSFILNTKTAEFVNPIISGAPASAVTFSQVVYDDPSNPDVFKSAQGIWIEAIKVTFPPGTNQDKVGYIDFHIRACWDSPGRSVPVTLGTIVRLYVPIIP